MVYFFGEGTFYLNSRIRILDTFCRVWRLNLCLQPDHGSATVVVLAVQIAASLTLILTIQCNDDITDMLEEKISAGKTEICWFGCVK